MIPLYFKNQSVPILSYTYTKTISNSIFNYNKALRHLQFDEFLQTPASCDCSKSPFQYAPVGHVITGDMNFVENDHLHKILSCGPKFREPRNFKIIMDSVEEYGRKWNKMEKVELDTFSEWVKAVRKFLRGRIGQLKSHIYSTPISVFKDPDVIKCLRETNP